MVKNLPASAGEVSSIPESERFPGVRNGNPLQCSCLKNSMNGGAWWATSAWGHKEADRTEHTCTDTQTMRPTDYGMPALKR